MLVKHALQRGGSMARAILVDMFYPKVCPGCGLRGVWLCEICRETVPVLDHAICLKCGSPQHQPPHENHHCRIVEHDTGQARAAYPYTGWSAAAVRRFKYGDEPSRADDLASRMLPMLADIGTIDVVVPVPLHASKLNLRGYNQSELLATRIAAHANRPMTPLLIRTRATRAQVDLDRTSRHDNVAGAFSLNPDWAVSPGQRVLLIDDVRTTGATTDACATVLTRDAKAQSVSVLTFAQELSAAELHRLMQTVSVSPLQR